MIKFTVNSEKALQVLLWILNKKPRINKYNIMKIVFEADCYSFNHNGRPIYGDKYVAMDYGTVPSTMKNIIEIKSNVPFMEVEKNSFIANAKPDMDIFSESDIEALEHGMKEYADLSFDEVKDKNHQHRAWKNRIEDLKHTKSSPIPYEDMIDNQDVLEDLLELGSLTENMVL